jgi:hypothetical protein
MGIYRCKICIMAPPDACALCLKIADLTESHIVPSFFGTYLEETSATGYMRGSPAPNLRRQDLRRKKLLCDVCEGRFAVWEKEYSEQALERVQDDGFTELEYGPWLLPFLVSVSWRVLESEKKSILKDSPKFALLIRNRSENWRLFLLGKRKQPTGEHHLFIVAGVPTSLPAEVHEKTLHYLLRSVDVGTAGDSRSFFVYTKALRSLIFSPLIPASPQGWIRTRVHAGFGRLISPQEIAMKGFGQFLLSRVQECFANPLSEKQKAKISEAILQNPRKALSSESYKVHEATKHLITGPNKGADR